MTVCVATYNQDRYIEECLLSVLAQAGDIPIEILLGNDGFSPETPHIVKRLSDRFPNVIRYFAHEKNLGASRNYQFLVERANGEYIAHLDGDDYWLPGKLRAQVSWLESHPNSPACYTNAVVISNEGNLLGAFASTVPPEIDLEYLLESGNFLNHSSLIYRSRHRDVVLNIDDEFIDYRLHLGFARLGKLGVDARTFTVYRANSEHSMIKTTPEKVRILFFDALRNILPEAPAKTRRNALANAGVTYTLDLLRFRFRRAKSGWQNIMAISPPDNIYAFVLSWFILLKKSINWLAISAATLLRSEKLWVYYRR